MENKFKDKHFEECIVQALIVDHRFAEQMTEVLNVDYFDLEYLKETTRILFDYYGKYRTFPSYKLLLTMVKELPDGLLKEQIASYLFKIKKEPLNGDMQYVKDASLDFCKKRSLLNAMEASLALVEEKKYEQIALEVKKALQAGAERSIGHDFKADIAKRRVIESYAAIPTPWEEVNRKIKGGLGRGKFGAIAGLTGIGKTHALVDLGAHAVMSGFNVVHYTLELSEIDVGNRYDARISGISVDNLIENKDFVEKSINKLCTGTLIIKEYPARAASLLTLKNHYDSLVLRGTKPDLIIIDYADLMKPPGNYESKRLAEEAIWESLSGWAKEIQAGIWTVAQINREGFGAEVLGLQHLAECLAKSFISDLFLTINRKKDSPTPDLGNMFFAKSRLGPDGIKFPMLVNTMISRIEILSPDSFDGDDVDDKDPMYKLKEKFKKFRSGKAREMSSSDDSDSIN
jgi:replicative DNA helicase